MFMPAIVVGILIKHNGSSVNSQVPLAAANRKNTAAVAGKRVQETNKRCNDATIVSSGLIGYAVV